MEAKDTPWGLKMQSKNSRLKAELESLEKLFIEALNLMFGHTKPVDQERVNALAKKHHELVVKRTGVKL